MSDLIIDVPPSRMLGFDNKMDDFIVQEQSSGEDNDSLVSESIEEHKLEDLDLNLEDFELNG